MPSVELIINSNHTTQWVGEMGVRFAQRISKTKRHKIYNFVTKCAQRLPIKVKIAKISINRPLPITADEQINEWKLFRYSSFLIFMRLEDCVTEYGFASRTM